MGNFGLCKICEKQEAICKSHIIPKNFYKRIQGDTKGLNPYDHNFQKHGPHLQAGLWEQGILCRKCDGMIGNYDKYAYHVLPAGLKRSQIHQRPQGLRTFILDPINVRHFKLFLVSLLWRMSVSKDKLFSMVKLGIYENRFLKILKNPKAWEMIPVEVVFIHFVPPWFDKILLSPHNMDFDGVQTIWVFLPPWKLVVKVDDKAYSDLWDQFRIREDRQIIGFIQEKEETPEYQMLRQWVQNGKALELQNKRT